MHASSTLPALTMSIGLLLSTPAAAVASPAPAPSQTVQISPPTQSASTMIAETPAAPPVEEPPTGPAAIGPEADPAPSTNGRATTLVPTPVEEVRVDRAEALEPSADGASLRYTAAGILSIVAFLLAVGIAIVAQPRRRRGTH